MSRWSVFEQTRLLDWKLRQKYFRWRITEAQQVLRKWLQQCKTPYVAYSGGKDSQVVVDLILHVDRSVKVVWHDEGWILPGTVEVVQATEAFYGISIIRVHERQSADEFFAEFGIWPRCSQRRPVDFEADHWSEIVEHFGFDGVAMGLRMDESSHRYLSLRKTSLRKTHYDNLWHVYPIRSWTWQDVWSYILANNLPYHPGYQRMIEAGVPPEQARVGPLTANRVYAFGILATLKYLWPETWNAFVAENPEVQSFG